MSNVLSIQCAKSYLVGRLVKVKEGRGTNFIREGDIGRVLSIDSDGDAWVKWDDPKEVSSDNIWCSLIDRLEIVDEISAGREEPEAKANLIAAAPELLDALQDAICALEVCGKDFDFVLSKARAAIAKARGES